MMFYEQEREEQERRQRELQEQLMRNYEIIDRKADELTAILDRKIEKNTVIAKTFVDVSDKAEAIADKMYNTLNMFRELERHHPEVKENNAKLEKVVHELQELIRTLHEKTALFQDEADRLIAERKTELAERLDKVTEVPAYHRGNERQEQQEKHKNKRTNEIER